MTFRSHMDAALAEAKAAAQRGEVPVGAVIVSPGGDILARAGNRTRELSDRLGGHVIYVTLEPCPMCAGAIAAARLAKLFYGASDPKSGGVAQGARVFTHPQCHHAPEVYDGINAVASEQMLKAFFEAKRKG
jgi:tRNA(adenine34) deaminase